MDVPGGRRFALPNKKVTPTTTTATTSTNNQHDSASNVNLRVLVDDAIQEAGLSHRYPRECVKLMHAVHAPQEKQLIVSPVRSCDANELVQCFLASEKLAQQLVASPHYNDDGTVVADFVSRNWKTEFRKNVLIPTAIVYLVFVVVIGFCVGKIWGLL